MPLPDWIAPMAATLTEKRFTDAAWLFERKFDGIRLLVFKDAAGVRLYSRTRRPQHLPALAAALAALPADELILDGEVTWNRDPAYHVFDVLWIEGRDVTADPLETRRERLAALPLSPPIFHVPSLDDDEPWSRACREGWEGVIAKRKDSCYESRRSPHWLKMKCELTATLIVGGFTDPQGARPGLGALLVGHHLAGDFVFAGKVGTGFDTRLLTELRARLDAIEIGSSPFTKATGLPRVRAHWVTPLITVRVAFIEWTVHGKLRHSRLLAVTS